ncbi:MAG: 16S rRNA (cytosine(1402)-N(4))-methyltransferase RsmH [Clostridia bacterium]|nr:16S rRNA (cytosine(1402)-N(4))-methyltransferase RsmH [Clostridia bacterium]MBQ6003342.1 16S rRNA (cytosine(1402)-N(4))-methyltransferase RsmH [Clostridia bacterium]MBR0437639.1 16S rRNA (cytosine(1402)-N(4))-methyltransferase RsmH [Clostridia bacterium]MBR6136045.1 16S rRNA (cytosine(1402)-N(4))-methyltransferase RsmH [Clostridia bacterium]MBR6822136.1 16S rRNA (cytosine(1402)-N(4))-methyltransferase RsmH [Clostridia bacterium]
MTHTTVLLHETVNSLPLETGKIFVDCTLGGGGHSLEILKSSEARLIAIDKDEYAIDYSKERLKEYSDRITFVRSDFREIRKVLEDLGVEKVDGLIADLGVSSFQLDDESRGFSYMKDSPIDMRMDRDDPFSAEQIVNGYPKDELIRILYEYGEEKYAPRIAEAIIRNRPIETTGQLSEIVKSALPAAERRKNHHPAKKTFQAIRIETNGELETLKSAVEDFIDVLNDGGVAAIITFHSLEDRIVKEAFRKAENPCTCPPSFPVCVCGKKSRGRVMTKKPIVPSEEEVEDNPRARSAKLRVFRKSDI